MNQTDPTACPYCQHAAHRPGVECEGGVDHGPGRWHRCLCLNLVDADRACPPQMTCQGGTLGYADVWYRQQGLAQPSSDGETWTGVASIGFPSTGKAEPAASAVLPEPTDRAAIRAETLLEAAELVGNDDDCDCGGCDTCVPRQLAAELRRLAVEAHDTETQQPAPDLAERKERYAVAIHDAMESDLSLVDQEPGYQALIARAAEAAMALADAEAQQQPTTEAEAAATLARECVDRPAVIRWCADRVRSTDGDYAVLAAADYLDDLATEIDEAVEEPAPVAQQPAAEASVESWARALAGARVMGRGGLPFDQLPAAEQEAFREQARQIATEQQATAADGEETPLPQRDCNCSHPADEHSVYGCVDGCDCEWMPRRSIPRP